MSAARVIWICWCLFWVVAWLVVAVATVWTVVGFLVGVVAAAGSGLAILLPVGKGRPVTPHPPPPWPRGPSDPPGPGGWWQPPGNTRR
jgi:hypothetical protein